MDRRKATWDGRAILFLIVGTIVSTIVLLPVSIFSLVIPLTTTLLIIHQLLLRVIFRGPSKRSLPFSESEWDVIQIQENGVDIYGYINYQSVKTDLVVFVHGWQSSSEKFTERIRMFKDRGLHTLAHDMRGHGIAPDTAEWTAGKVIQDLKTLLDSIDNSKVNKVHFYGHSLGGFICVGMHNDRHQGWWKDRYGTLMLESPMVAYSPIMEEMSSRFSILTPYLKRWALKGFNKIHPEVDSLQWEDIDMPAWGVPQVPTLLLQAKNDSRLGTYHYDLLKEQDMDLHPHLIESLTHSKNRVNTERDEIIITWIEERMS